ncbi:hypothetical protein [Microbacterium sp. No. 7]|uniref:hypothetical protein n=1 Tax=Microbacterium sp. No. 7 TaxID=1714373 RepID=UPI0006D20113|nr:hypothetical protein [Microbacterium sp. No. 7]ALJ20394.1 hypothetical protein AOA12_10925 [Microbacterium sp. No. 7]
MTMTEVPRPKTLTWEVGDVVQCGSVRWALRTITGQAVELEAMNVPHGIWWRTTLGELPAKATS